MAGDIRLLTVWLAGGDGVGRGEDQILKKGQQGAVDIRLLRRPPANVASRGEVAALAAALAPAFYVDVGNVCNQKCSYCAVPRDSLYRTACGQAEAMAAAAVSRGHRTAVLIGGEPTIWPHLRRVLESMRELGVERVVLTTNGLMLSYPSVLDELLDAGVSLVGLSLDDFDDSRQCRLARRADNPNLVRAALANIAQTGVESYIYSVVTALLAGRSAEYVRGALDTAARFPSSPAFLLAGLKPVSEALANVDDLSLSLSDTAAEVRAIIDGTTGRVTVAYRDIPLCLMPDHLPWSMDFHHEHAALHLDSGELRPAPLAADRTFIETCTGCRLRNWCPGLYRDYLKRYGSGEFATIA